MKTQRQENFPVATCLFPKKHRQIVTDYYNFARYCDDIADTPSLSQSQKLSLLEEAEQSLYSKASLDCALKLKEDFIHENLDFSLATDLLVAFKSDVKNAPYQTWAQLLEYCKYSAAPVGRFILALFNENPSTYMPASALCCVLQIVNHVQDVRSDVQNLNRLYFPQEMLNEFKVSSQAFRRKSCSKNLHFLLNDVLKRCEDLIKDAKILPEIVKNFRLKIYLCVVLILTKILIKKLYNKDVLKSEVKLSTRDRIYALVRGFVQALVTKKQTLS